MGKKSASTKKILDDFDLFNLMLTHSKNSQELYQPGPYWQTKVNMGIKQISKYGISDFRGIQNKAATSFGDNVVIDLSPAYNSWFKNLAFKFTLRTYPFNIMYTAQTTLSYSYFLEANYYKNFYLKKSKRVQYLLSKYKIDFETTRGGCLSFGMINGINISHHYLQLLDTLDYLASMENISNKKTFMEIGGGFGVNVHLMINFFRAKKIIYVDIFPSLYVATQYLKSFYGNKVIDFRKFRNNETIKFTDSDELEIFCILPQQIEQVESKIELFHNAHSFVEMTDSIITNYASVIQAIMAEKNSAISLVSYAEFDPISTINPYKLTDFFSGKITNRIYPTLNPNSSNLHSVIL